MDNHKRLEEKEYALGVNMGYVMNKYSPEIAELLVQPESKSGRLKGFKDGMEQYEKEINADKYPEWLTKQDFEPKTPVTDKKHNKDVERD